MDKSDIEATEKDRETFIFYILAKFDDYLDSGIDVMERLGINLDNKKGMLEANQLLFYKKLVMARCLYYFFYDVKFKTDISCNHFKNFQANFNNGQKLDKTIDDINKVVLHLTYEAKRQANWTRMYLYDLDKYLLPDISKFLDMVKKEYADTFDTENKEDVDKLIEKCRQQRCSNDFIGYKEYDE